MTCTECGGPLDPDVTHTQHTCCDLCTTDADTWGQLLAAIRTVRLGIEHWPWNDTNPSAGPDFEALLDVPAPDTGEGT